MSVCPNFGPTPKKGYFRPKNTQNGHKMQNASFKKCRESCFRKELCLAIRKKLFLAFSRNAIFKHIHKKLVAWDLGIDQLRHIHERVATKNSTSPYFAHIREKPLGRPRKTISLSLSLSRWPKTRAFRTDRRTDRRTDGRKEG